MNKFRLYIINQILHSIIIMKDFSKSGRVAFLIYFLIGLTWQLALTPISNTVNPSYAKSTSSLYTLTFNSAQTAVQTYSINIFFDNTLYALTAVSNCQIRIDTTVLSTAACSVNTSANAIVFTNLNINRVFSTMTIVFNTITARYASSPTLQFNFNNVTTAALLKSYFVTVSVTNAVMTCSLTSSSPTIGANSTYTVNFQPIVLIQANSMIQIQLDPWGPYNASNFNPSNATNVCNNQCTISAPQNNGNISEIIQYSSLYSSGSSSSEQSLILSRARNPSSSKPLSITITVFAIVSAFQSSSYMTCTSSLTASVPVSFNSLSFSPSNTSISASNIISMFLNPLNPISSACFLRIIPSSDMALSYTFNAYNQGTVPSLVAGVTNQLLIGNIVRSISSSSPSLLILSNFTLTNPPYAIKPSTLLFRTELLFNSTYYTIDQQTITITSTVSTMTSFGITVTNTSIGATTQYVLWFQTVNRLISGSFIRLVFPSTLLLNLSGTTCSFSASGICLFLNSTVINLALNASVNALTNISVILSNMVNPTTTTPTSSILVTTYYSDINSVVDQISSGLSVTCSPIILKQSGVSSSSLVVAARSSYTFTLVSTLTTLRNSIVNLTFPSGFSSSGFQLTNFSISGTIVSGCTITVSSLTILFNSSCISQDILTTQSIQFIISNITNPSSTKTSNSFQISIFYNNFLMEYLYNGITVQMTTPATLTYFQVTPDDASANAQNRYTFDVNFLLTHYQGDRVLLTLPTNVVLSGVFLCASLTTNVTVSCTQSSPSIIQFIISYTSTVYPNSLKFTVSNLTNNWFAGTVSFSLQTTTNDSTFYYVQQATGVVNYQAATLVATVNNDNNIILMGTTQLTISLSSPFSLTRATNTSMVYIVFGIPTDFTPIDSTCILSYPSAICNKASTQILNLTNIGQFSTTLTLKFNASTTYFTQSSNFDIKLYYGSALVLLNNALRVSSFCVNPCKQCTTTATQCISCLPSPQTQNTTYFSANSSCVRVCPNQYYLISSNNTCGTCNASACLNCQNSPNTCISCIIGRNLFNKTCLSVCPSGFYAFNGECISCAPPCSTCNSSSICLSCNSGSFLDIGTNATRCVVTCTNTSYLGIEGSCKLCTANCLTCSVATDNCTSCNTTNFQYFQNSCIRLCPSGMYSNASGTCATCKQPCQTCSSLTQCNSCVLTYYFFNNTICTKNCPNGYLGVVNSCIQCDSSCATCTGTLENCTACNAGKLLYQNQCLDQCPTLTYPYNKTCTTCIQPCVTCTSSPESCLTCIQGMLLLDNSCVNSCPNTGYYLNGDSCVSCPSNCVTCQSAIQCSICQDGYYNLNGGCTKQCPANYPILDGNNCSVCSTQCITCSVSKENCTQCRIGYYKYTYTCVETCPFGFYSNAVSFTCEDGLTSRIVFFPILIIVIIIISIISVSKALESATSFSTTLASLLSVCQIAIWIFMIAELSDPMKEVDVDYVLPIALICVAFVSLVTCNILFYYFNSRRSQGDQYARIWLQNNVVYVVYNIVKYTSLGLSHKLFRISYSKFFNLYTLSMPFKKKDNVFPLATIFTLVSLLLCQIPMIICSFSLAYVKIQKDQMFYTSIQCLVLTIMSAIISLIDIYKPQDYFEDNDFVRTKKYLQKVKDSSFNQLEDGFYLQKDEGSVEGQKFVGHTGGKFTSIKQDPSTFNNLYFQQSSSIVTDIDQSKSNRKNNKKNKINIFDPIKEQDEQYYQQLMYKEEQIKTQARIQQQRKLSANVHNESDQAIDYDQQKLLRGQKLGVQIDELWDDNRSMIEQRPLKQKWNNILTHRQKLSRQIFNTLDEYSTKELQKIQEPKNVRQEQDQSQRNYNNNDDENEQYSTVNKRRRKRKIKKGHSHLPGNTELQKIYLQRLTQKKKHKDIFASSQSIKYDF